jgi:hypothetical protein
MPAHLILYRRRLPTSSPPHPAHLLPDRQHLLDPSTGS